MSAEEMFTRQADRMKARNSPTRSRIAKDGPLFKKKMFKQAMFSNGSNKFNSANDLPKGKFDLKLVSAMENQE